MNKDSIRDCRYFLRITEFARLCVLEWHRHLVFNCSVPIFNYFYMFQEINAFINKSIAFFPSKETK